MALSLLLFVTYARAADLNCQTRQTVRCPCPASMQVDCGGGYQGFLDDTDRANAMTIAVYDKSTGLKKDVTLNAPPRPLRDYHGAVDHDAWVLKQLGDKGVRVGSNTQLDLVSAAMPERTKLYQDPNKTKPAPNQPAGAGASQISCFYTAKPTMLRGPKCSDQICTAYVKCYRGNTPLGEQPAGCKADGDGCPSASACAGDEDVKTQMARAVQTSQLDDDARARAGR